MGQVGAVGTVLLLSFYKLSPLRIAIFPDDCNPNLRETELLEKKVCFVFIYENVTQDARECFPPSVIFQHFQSECRE